MGGEVSREQREYDEFLQQYYNDYLDPRNLRYSYSSLFYPSYRSPYYPTNPAKYYQYALHSGGNTVYNPGYVGAGFNPGFYQGGLPYIQPGGSYPVGYDQLYGNTYSARSGIVYI